VSRKIFVSYRRSDSEAHAGRIAERLMTVFGAEHVFLDTESIKPGEQFPERISLELGRARVVLVLIGGTWLTAADEFGRRRIDDPTDWVRRELEISLASPGLEVVPVLLDGAHAMPPKHAFPESIAAISARNAIRVKSRTFGADMRALVDWLVTLNLAPPLSLSMAAFSASDVESSQAPSSSVNWDSLARRFGDAQRSTIRLWAGIAGLLATCATLVVAALTVARIPLNLSLPFPGLLAVFAVISIPKYLTAREKLVRSENLLTALHQERDPGQYQRLLARALEMYT
jgi:hypothetical protein